MKASVRWTGFAIMTVALVSASALPALAATADLSVTKVDAPDPVLAGSNITYTITVTNAGPDAASNVTLSDTIPAGTTFVSATGGGWTCGSIPVGGTGTEVCSDPSVPVGSSTITLVVNVAAATPTGTVITNSATASSPDDAVSSNNTASTTTTVGTGTGANLRVTKADSPDPVSVGGNITYSITVANEGPLAASSVSLSDVVPANTTFVSVTAPAGWTCPALAVGGTGTQACTTATLAPSTSASITLVVKVNAGTPTGTAITNTATASSATPDPDSTSNTATAVTTVGTVADLCSMARAISGTRKSDTLNGTSADDIICGGNGRDTIHGRGGNDVILGQNGKDALDGGDGNDTLGGGNGKDHLVGGSGLDVLRGGNGPDLLDAQDGAPGDSMDGGLAMDSCKTDAGDLTVACP